MEKHAYYQNYCIDSNQILRSDKDQMPFVGGPNTQQIQDGGGRHREKSKYRHISATVEAIASKYGTLTQFDPLDHYVSKIGPK